MAVSLQQHVREGLIAVINAFNTLLTKVQPDTISFNMLAYIGACWRQNSPAEVGFRVAIPDATKYTRATVSNVTTVNIVDLTSNTNYPNLTINGITLSEKTCGSAVITFKFNSALINNHIYRFYGTQPIVVLS